MTLAYEWTEKNERRKENQAQDSLKSNAVHIVVDRTQGWVPSCVTTEMLQCLSLVCSAKISVCLIMTDKTPLEIK